MTPTPSSPCVLYVYAYVRAHKSVLGDIRIQARTGSEDDVTQRAYGWYT